jgi:heme exporter protein CcmD
MADLADFGRYAPYIGMAYGVSVVALGALIAAQRRRLKRAIEAEKAAQKEN